MSIYEVHRTDPHNIGDHYCNPSRYFDLPIEKTIDIYSNFKPKSSDTLIIGGGGLIRRTFQKRIQSFNATGAKTIFWSIGHNFREKETHMWWPDWITSAKLWSVRDYLKMQYYVPCVTCMHPAFDDEYKIKEKEVYFIHAHRNRNESYRELYGKKIITNDQQDFDKVIKFLGTAETVITDSYHGAYWALLLGRKVKVVNWTTKFLNFKHQPAFIDSIKSCNVIKSADYKPDFNNYLQECRTYNKQFYSKVIAELSN